MNGQRGTEASGYRIGGLFTFGLFGLFVLFSLFIVAVGVSGYGGVLDAGESVSEVRTSLGYVMGKLRSEAGVSGIRLEHTHGVDALILTEVYAGDTLETVIFHRDGALYEVMLSGGAAFDPDSAWRLAEVEAFAMEQAADGLLRLTATAADGRSQTLHVAILGEREAGGL